MSAIAERPEDPYSYARENTPVDLIMSDTNVPVDIASQDNPLEVGDAHGYISAPDPELEISGRIRLDNTNAAMGLYDLDTPSFRKRYMYYDLKPYEEEQIRKGINMQRENLGYPPLTEPEMLAHIKRFQSQEDTTPHIPVFKRRRKRIMQGEIF